MGYADATQATAIVRVFGEEYAETDFAPGDLEAGRRIPEFVWDNDRCLTWGARLYADSLIVAAEIAIFQRLIHVRASRRFRGG